MISFTSMLLPAEVQVPPHDAEAASPAGCPAERSVALVALCVSVAAAFAAALWLV